jgi:thiamine monophosphate kinase
MSGTTGQREACGGPWFRRHRVAVDVAVAVAFVLLDTGLTLIGATGWPEHPGPLAWAMLGVQALACASLAVRRRATLAVVGVLGRSAAGYHLWDNGIDGFDELRRAHLAPEPPYGQGRVAADGGATAMTDVSDGLVADLGHIAYASGVGINVSTAALTPDRDALLGAAAAAGVDAWTWVLGGGEDHALVATFHGAPPKGWRAIGTVLDGPPLVLVDGEEWSGNPGWQSYQ